MINNKREICISVSSNPGSFGETVHNAGYKFQGLNFFYKAIKVVDLENTINAIKLLQIKGCSISMPFKEKILDYIDIVDEDAKTAGAVNTILNNNNILKGFNTDVFGAFKALESLNIYKNENVLILGAGGVARAIIIALKKHEIFNVFVTNRNVNKAKILSNAFNCNVIDWEERNNFKSSVLINATPIGMKDNDNFTPIDIKSLNNFHKVMDVVVNENDTKLIKAAKNINMPNVTGLYMTFFQAASQYKIYTGFNAPLLHMIEAYNVHFNKKIKLDLN